MTVYVIRQSDSDYFKVGYTEEISGVEGRRQSLQTGNPHKLIVYCIIPDGTLTLETDIHQKLLAYHTDGGSEWFFLPETKLNEILERKASNCDYSFIQRYYRTQSETGRSNGYNVRPLCGRQQNSTSSPGENVLSERWKDTVPTSNQPSIIPVSQEHYQRFQIGWGEELGSDG